MEIGLSKDTVFAMNRQVIDVLSSAINIIETSCDKNEKEVDETLKDLIEIKRLLKSKNIAKELAKKSNGGQ